MNLVTAAVEKAPKDHGFWWDPESKVTQQIISKCVYFSTKGKGYVEPGSGQS